MVPSTLTLYGIESRRGSGDKSGPGN
uniref:Uncharacterized protein n=1 Tax=Anguilla anguilla TaxID=7936 RepID=A0A0E9U3G1_ANGAN